MIDASDLGQRIKTKRFALNLSQQQLAERIGTSKGVISNLERGRAKASVYLGRIAQELQVSIAWLEGQDGDQTHQLLPVENQRIMASCNAYLDVAMHALLNASRQMATLNSEGAANLEAQTYQIKSISLDIEAMRRQCAQANDHQST